MRWGEGGNSYVIYILDAKRQICVITRGEGSFFFLCEVEIKYSRRHTGPSRKKEKKLASACECVDGKCWQV